MKLVMLKSSGMDYDNLLQGYYFFKSKTSTYASLLVLGIWKELTNDVI